MMMNTEGKRRRVGCQSQGRRAEFERLESRELLAYGVGGLPPAAAECNVQTVELPAVVAEVPLVSDVQQANIQKLVGDLRAIHADSVLTPAHLQQLAQDVAAVVDGANRPAPDTVDQLQNDWATASADGDISPLEAIMLAQDVKDVLDSANIPVEEAQAVVDDLQAIVAATNIDAADLQLIAEDVSAIAEEFRQQHPQDGQPTGPPPAVTERGAALSSIIADRHGALSSLIGDRSVSAGRR
jgi:hypothetical protein